MASFLTSALGGVNNLSHLVDRVSQLKDNIERTLDNAVGDNAEIADHIPDVETVVPAFSSFSAVDQQAANGTVVLERRRSSNAVTTEGNPAPSDDKADVSIAAEVHQPSLELQGSEQPTITVNTETMPAVPAADADIATVDESAAVVEEANGHETDRERELLATLKRREAQLEKVSRQLAEQEGQLNALRESLETASVDKRVRAAEAKAAQLMKEGLALSEKQGKTEQALRKLRKEKEEFEQKEKSLSDQLKKEQEARVTLQSELNELRDVRKRGEVSIAQISETSADNARKLEEARAQAAQALQREQEMKTAMERTFAEVADQKKLITSLTQQLNAAKRDAEHAKFQLKEQLDSRQLHGSRADSMERSLAEAKAALDEHMRESRQTESELRSKLQRANEQLHVAEKRAEEAATKALELTAPLLRQIDQMNEQRSKGEQHASTLLTRAVAAEAAEAEATAGKRRAEQARSELAVKVSELETLLTSTKADAARALSDCKLAFKRAEEAEKERDAIQKAMDALRTSSDAKIAEQRLTEMQLRQNLAAEMDRFERSKRLWEEKSREMEERHEIDLRKMRQAIESSSIGMLPATPVPLGIAGNASSSVSLVHEGGGFSSPPPSHPRRFQNDGASSVISASAMMAASQEEILGNVLFGDDFSAPNSVGMDVMSTTEAGVTSSRYLLQASELQSGIRRRDAQIKLLTTQLDSAIKQKEELVREVVNLQQRVKALESAAEKETSLLKEVGTLQKQNTLLLELLGEKEEQIEALQSDLDDVKAKFREQIEILLKA